MKFDQPLILGTIEKRYKRFLADLILDNDQQVTAHVANTGSMTTCWDKGWQSAVEFIDSPTRKLKYSLHMTHNGKTWIGVNTSLTNKLVHEALQTKSLTDIQDYDEIKSEVKFGDSRLDFQLSSQTQKTFIEVKNVTLIDEKQGRAIFPDAKSTRAQKHVQELIKIKKLGHRSILLFVIQREDTKNFSIAHQIDPEYAELVKKAVQEGVEVLAYQCKVSPEEIKIDQKVKLILDF